MALTPSTRTKRRHAATDETTTQCLRKMLLTSVTALIDSTQVSSATATVLALRNGEGHGAVVVVGGPGDTGRGEAGAEGHSDGNSTASSISTKHNGGATSSAYTGCSVWVLCFIIFLALGVTIQAIATTRSRRRALRDKCNKVLENDNHAMEILRFKEEIVSKGHLLKSAVNEDPGVPQCGAVGRWEDGILK